MGYTLIKVQAAFRRSREQLEAWAKNLGWLHARKDRKWACFPALSPYELFIKETLEDIGLTHQGEQLPYSEIRAWEEITGLKLTISEAEIIKHLSGLYMVELRGSAEDKARDMPYMNDYGRERRRKEVNTALRASLALMKKEAKR